MNTNSIPRQPAGRGCVKLLFALPFILIGGMITGVLVLILAGSFLVVNTHPGEVDTIVILSGGGVERAEEAALAYQEHKGSVVLLTLSRATDSLSKSGQPPYNYYYQLYAGGVPADNIVLTRAVSESTLDESSAVLEMMHRLNLTSCIVITDPYHTRRTNIIFRDAFQGSGIEVSVRPAREHWYHPYDWFMSKRGWNTTILEYTKLFAYWLGVDGN